MGTESCGDWETMKFMEGNWIEHNWKQRTKIIEEIGQNDPQRTAVDFVVFHLSPWSFWALCLVHPAFVAGNWWNKPFRTMTLKSSCAALKWIGTSMTPQQGVQCDHHLWWMHSHVQIWYWTTWWHRSLRDKTECPKAKVSKREDMLDLIFRKRLTGYHECHHDDFCFLLS